VADHAQKRYCNMVIAGHIHSAKIEHYANGIIYANIGDFCESKTALVEHYDGTFEIIHAENFNRNR